MLYSQCMLTNSPDVQALTRMGSAMADATRSRILLHMLEGPVYPSELAVELGLTRSNVSNHLACLRGCGLVEATIEGRRTRYDITDPHLTRALTALVQVVIAVDEGCVCHDASCEPLCCCARHDHDGLMEVAG